MCSYVFVKKQRVPGEPFNINDDLDAIDIEFVDCTNEEWPVSCEQTIH